MTHKQFLKIKSMKHIYIHNPLSIYNGSRTEWVQLTEWTNAKWESDLSVKTMTKFEKENRHRWHAFIDKKKNRAQLYKGQITLSNRQIAIQRISDCETFGVLHWIEIYPELSYPLKNWGQNFRGTTLNLIPITPFNYKQVVK